MPPLDQVTVRVPATSANLGPGFDCLGMALNLYLKVHCRLTEPGLRITIGGIEKGDITAGAANPIFRALRLVYEAAGQPVPGVAIHIDNGIPVSRGLGSSAAAVAAGLVAANSLLGEPFDRRKLLAIGLPLEGHPDNLAPALLGGVTASTIGDGEVITVPVALGRPFEIVLFVPDFIMSTKDARAVLPDNVPRADAVFNLCRSSLLVAALAAGDLGVLRWAMEDRLHQPYRSRIFPALPHLIQAALDQGAAGAAMSGAGSSVIAICAGEPERVAGAMEDAAARFNLPGRPVFARLDDAGALVID